MALGTSSNNKNTMWEPSYYSRLRIKNPSDNLALTFSFWKGTLRIGIGDANGLQDGKINEYAYIHLSPTKAFIMSQAVKNIISEPESDKIFGVDTGAGEVHGFIAIGREMGKPFLFIAKVAADGSYESSQRFNFNMDYNYMLRVHDIKHLKCQKEYDNSVELNQFMSILVDYARCASGAIGASVYDIGRYESAKNTNLIRKIAEKTGALEYNKNYNNSQSPSFFSGAPSENRSYYQSISDLEQELG